MSISLIRVVLDLESSAFVGNVRNTTTKTNVVVTMVTVFLNLLFIVFTPYSSQEQSVLTASLVHTAAFPSGQVMLHVSSSSSEVAEHELLAALTG